MIGVLGFLKPANKALRALNHGLILFTVIILLYHVQCDNDLLMFENATRYSSSSTPLPVGPAGR